MPEPTHDTQRYDKPRPTDSAVNQAAHTLAITQGYVHPDDDWRYELPPLTVRRLETEAKAVLEGERKRLLEALDRIGGADRVWRSEVVALLKGELA